MTQNLESGYTKIRGKKKPILWTGMYAQHLAEEHEKSRSLHPYLHIKAQQMLAKSTVFKTVDGWVAWFEASSHTVLIPVLVRTNFVIIKTCIAYNMTIEKAKGQKGLTGYAPLYLSDEFIETLMREVGYETPAIARSEIERMRKLFLASKAKAAKTKRPMTR